MIQFDVLVYTRPLSLPPPRTNEDEVVGREEESDLRAADFRFASTPPARLQRRRRGSFGVEEEQIRAPPNQNADGRTGGNP